MEAGKCHVCRNDCDFYDNTGKGYCYECCCLSTTQCGKTEMRHEYKYDRSERGTYCVICGVQAPYYYDLD